MKLRRPFRSVLDEPLTPFEQWCLDRGWIAWRNKFWLFPQSGRWLWFERTGK
jgi:hypothetical protein